MASTRIEWTESSWNPVTGCTKISPGCMNCYAERMAKRLKAMGQPNYRNGFEVTCHPHMLDLPLKWRKPRTIFVNSMSDLFHDDVPAAFIEEIFTVMNRARRHTFQVLTKRVERMEGLVGRFEWSPNIWMGVTVENSDYLYRIDHLRSVPAAVRFLSIEPMLGPLPDLDLERIDWVIVGGESGPGARPIKKEWVLEVRDLCVRSGVPFFFKQWGGVQKKKAGRLLDRKIWDQMPKPTVQPLWHRARWSAPSARL
ncbi:MAG: phage Gp37/Gp68 family protein [Desulfobulbaceae bacterium]